MKSILQFLKKLDRLIRQLNSLLISIVITVGAVLAIGAQVRDFFGS